MRKLMALGPQGIRLKRLVGSPQMAADRRGAGNVARKMRSDSGDQRWALLRAPCQVAISSRKGKSADLYRSNERVSEFLVNHVVDSTGLLRGPTRSSRLIP